MKREEKYLDNLVEKLGNQLVEHCDSAIIIASYSGATGTGYTAKKVGNTHAVIGVMEEYLRLHKEVDTKNYMKWLEEQD